MITKNSYMNPVFDTKETNAVNDYLAGSGWVTEFSATKEFESMLSKYIGAKYVHCVPNATMGLLIASMLADIKYNETFSASAYTQAATVNGAILLGGKPNIVDTDNESYTIDLSNITTRVVFVTAINGRYSKNTAQRIKELQYEGHFVIEDAAQALASFSHNEHIGTFGDVGVVSFGSPKIITTGQGGAIYTNDKELSDRIHQIKNFGRIVRSGEVYDSFGLNFKFTDLQAAFGIQQLKKLDKISNHKKFVFETYRTNLSDIAEFIDTDLSQTTPTYPEILLKNPLNTHNKLKEKSIGTRTVYPSILEQPYHSRFKTKSLPNAEYIGSRGLILPSQFDLTEQDLEIIIKEIRKTLT